MKVVIESEVRQRGAGVAIISPWAVWLCVVAAVLSSLLIPASLAMQAIWLGLGAGMSLLNFYRFAIKPTTKIAFRPSKRRCILAFTGVATIAFIIRYLVLHGISTPVQYGDYGPVPSYNFLIKWLATHAVAAYTASIVILLGSTLVVALLATALTRAESATRQRGTRLGGR